MSVRSGDRRRTLSPTLCITPKLNTPPPAATISAQVCCSSVLCTGGRGNRGFWATSASHWLVTPPGPLLPPGTFTLKQPNRENTEFFEQQIQHLRFVGFIKSSLCHSALLYKIGNPLFEILTLPRPLPQQHATCKLHDFSHLVRYQ